MNLINLIIVLVVLVMAIVLHEMAHAFVSYALGDDTAKVVGRLSLNPLKHIDPFLTIILPMMMIISGGPIFGGAKPVPLNLNRIKYGEYGVALVALSGPLTNLLIAFISFGILVILKYDIQSVVGLTALTSVQINLGLFLFNIIPIPPLDGSRLIYAIAPTYVKQVMNKMERFGVLLILGIVILARPLIYAYMNSMMGLLIGLFEAFFR